MIKERRSIRTFLDEKVKKEDVLEILESARFAPSWCNLQIARYTIVQDEKILEEITNTCFKEFEHNRKIVSNVKNLAVLTRKVGKCGRLGAYSSPRPGEWEAFDSGLSCQNFCLAAWEKNIGTCVLGIYDEPKLASLINLKEDETISAIIVFGYFDKKEAPLPKRLSAQDISTFI